VSAAHQIRGFHGVTLAVADLGPTAEVLEGIRFERVGSEADGAVDGSVGRVRFDTGADRIGTVVDLVRTAEPRGRMGVGTVHHVAFELADGEARAATRERLGEFGMDATGIIDRTCFRAIHAREPGGVLFEFSTPDPGFAVDEDVDSLGRTLVPPERLEDQREEIEASLPPFDYASDPESASVDD